MVEVRHLNGDLMCSERNLRSGPLVVTEKCPEKS